MSFGILGDLQLAEAILPGSIPISASGTKGMRPFGDLCGNK
jgi:hypothetical protein